MVIAVAVSIGTSTLRAGSPRSKIMKIMLGTAIAVFSLGIGSSYAGDGDGQSATTLFTSIQNERPVAAPTGVTQNSGTAVQADDARPQVRGTWLFRVFTLP
jgi:hypothetical protein